MDKYYSFKDILKKDFFNIDISQKVSMTNVALCLLMTLIAAIFIYYVYKLTFKGVVYSHSFNVSLVIVCLVTSLIILTISSNVVLSLGMVGALSIVRFRTALKDPMDIVYMFWSIFVGIASGAGIYTVSIFGSLFIGVAIIVMTRKKSRGNSYMLIIHYTDEANDKVKRIISKIKCELRSKTITQGSIEMTVEIKLKGDNTAFMNELYETEGVIDVSLVSYNGDYAA